MVNYTFTENIFKKRISRKVSSFQPYFIQEILIRMGFQVKKLKQSIKWNPTRFVVYKNRFFHQDNYRSYNYKLQNFFFVCRHRLTRKLIFREVVWSVISIKSWKKRSDSTHCEQGNRRFIWKKKLFRERLWKLFASMIDFLFLCFQRFKFYFDYSLSAMYYMWSIYDLFEFSFSPNGKRLKGSAGLSVSGGEKKGSALKKWRWPG